MKYFIQTFGCQQNIADSERIAGRYQARGYVAAKDYTEADVVVINTCMVRQQAEDRVYGFVEKVASLKEKNRSFKIVVTGCMVGSAMREPTGKLIKKIRKRLIDVDEFLPADEIGFEYQAVRKDKEHAWIPITHGCNNFCTYCIVPFARGRERSRPFQEILCEAGDLAAQGYQSLTLLGQNVNSYGADLVKNKKIYQLSTSRKVEPVMVKHLGKVRIPTLFPYLLDAVCNINGIKKVSFMSSNPWDFSDELVEIIAHNPKINRELHLPVQSGDDVVLKRMNRWYTIEEYLALVEKIRERIPEISFTTDIIVGFPGETEGQFKNTVKLVEKVRFQKAYIGCYSPRPGTVAARFFKDDVSRQEKDRRFRALDNLINKKQPSVVRKQTRTAAGVG